jgi:hypothetical protein
MEKKLISMVDFVLNIGKTIEKYSYTPTMFNYKKIALIEKYATFLNQPLNLGMFVPAIEVDGKWEVLEEPESLKGFYETDKDGMIQERKDVKQYQTALDKVLFEGFRVEGKFISNYQLSYLIDRLDYITIQDLIKYAPTLTAKGLKDSGLK